MADDRQKPDDQPDADDEAAAGKDGNQKKNSAASDDEGDGAGKEDDKDEDAGPPLYKRPLFWIIVATVAAVLLIGGLLYWLHARKYVSTDDAFVDAHIVRIAAQTTGRLTRVPDNDNRHVNRGQLLAEIEPGTPATQLEQARAQVSQADAQIAQAQAQLLSAQATVRQYAAAALSPAAQALRAAHDYQRYAALRQLDAAAAAATQVEQARSTADDTAGQAAAARRQVQTAIANVAGARRQIDAARAQRSAAETQVQAARVVTAYLHIASPINGQVVNRMVDEGSYVAVGQQLMALVPDEMWITANFKETQLANMRVGQPVEIRIDAFPQERFTGHVDSFQRGAGQAFQLLPPQNATGNYVKVVQRVPVRILFDGANWRHYPIGPGMSVVPTVKVR